MPRQKITAYVPPDLADALRRVAAVKDRSVSDIVEDAVTRALSSAGREAEHAALVAKLDAMTRRLGVIERAQETLFEFTAHAARFSMSLAPDIPEADRVHVNARGAERFRNLLTAITNRLGAGKSVLRETFPAGPETTGPAPSAANGAHRKAPETHHLAEAAHD